MEESIKKFSESLNRLLGHNLNLNSESSEITNFSQKKRYYHITMFKSAYNELIKRLDDPIKDRLIKAYNNKDLGKLKKLSEELIEFSKNFPKTPEKSSFKISGIPLEIRLEINADLEELNKCYNSDCFRASIILCGRLLETALHRVYFEKTNNDLLEKSPGIGLGTLVAKLKEKNLILDPAIAQQIHLINQVRIYSVHKKQEPFNPSKDQTNAIILYTLDIIRKLFLKH